MGGISTSRTWHDRPHWGVYLMLASILIHVTGNIFEKILLGIYPLFQMAFIRALFRLIPLFIFLLRTKEIKTILSMQQLIRFGTQDRFTHAIGSQDYMREYFGLVPEKIVEKINENISCYSR